MPRLFQPWANTAAKITLATLAFGGCGSVGALMIHARTPFATHQYEPVTQPIRFDHRHHVADDRIDCRFCHREVDRSSTAGIPPTQVCMSCHGQIWNRSPMLAPVRQSYFDDVPIAWRRVHRLPDFVYFNHAIHVRKGVGCVTCHGRVDQMAAVMQDQPLTMSWCLDCHRDPAPHLRPRDRITDMAWRPDGDGAALGATLVREYDVHTRTSCTTCHR